MIDFEQEVEVSWNVANKDYYIDKGYIFTKFRDKFLVKAKDLPDNSKVKVKVTCDFCGDVVEKSFVNYTRSVKKHRKFSDKDACSACRAEKYKGSRKLDFDVVKEAFEKNGLILQTNEYINGKEPMPVICSNHKEIGVQYISYTSARHREKGCPFCCYEARKGEGNPQWQGGIYEFYKWCRDLVNPWRDEYFKRKNWVCELSGKRGKVVVHHKYPFNKIVKETMEDLGLPIFSNTGDYTQEQRDLIESELLRRHYDSDIAVVMLFDLHNKMHQMYSYKDMTPEEFEEFRDRYNNGEFEELLSYN